MKKTFLFIVAGLLILMMTSCTIEEILNYNEQNNTQYSQQSTEAAEVDPIKVKPPTGG